MLWVNPPQADEESSVMPLAGRREITVYDRVIVGSDGSPSAEIVRNASCDVLVVQTSALHEEV